MPTKTPLEVFFIKNGTPFSTKAYERKIAETDFPGELWFMLEGEGDLFFIEAADKTDSLEELDNRLEGPLTFVGRVKRDHVLFPFVFEKDRIFHLIFKATEPVKWLHISHLSVQEALQHSQLQSDMRRQMDHFLELFSFLPNLDKVVPMDESFGRHLLELQRNIIRKLGEKKDKEEVYERQKIENSRRFSEITMKTAREELQGILNEQDLMTGETRLDSLLQACQMAALYQGLPFHPGQHDFKAKERSEAIKIICDDAGVNQREIKLGPEWWKRSIGPIVGFNLENKPLVLLPDGISQYQCVDVTTRSVRRVDERLNQELQKTGYMFYRAFPNITPLRLRDLLTFAAKDNGGVLAKIVIAGFLAAFLAIILPFAPKILFSYVIVYSDHQMLFQLLLGWIALLIATKMFFFIREWLMVYFNGKIEHDLITSLWIRLLSLPLGFFRRYEAGDLIIRALAIDEIRKNLAGPNLRAILNALFSVLYLIPMIYFSPALSLVGIALIAPFFIYSIYVSVSVFFETLGIISLEQKANSLVLQFLGGISKIRLSGMETACFVMWEKIFRAKKKRQWHLQKVVNSSHILNYTLSQSGVLIIYVAAILMISQWNYQIDVGSFLAFSTAYGSFLAASVGLCTSILETSGVFAIWRNSKTILEETPELQSERNVTVPMSGDVVIDRVKFRYDLNDPYILNDVSFHAKPGEFIAIIGPSGSGKSTLARLMIGFETPESGAIYYDNKDLSTLNLRDVRKKIGTILQNSKLQDGTLRENVTGGGGYSDMEVIKTLIQVGFLEDLKALPMGLETIVANQGSTLSKGQIQRILIARAIIGNPNILIFDEATSALDNQTQEVVNQHLLNYQGTRIVIAHRLSTIRQANRVYSLEEGELKEIVSVDQ